MDRFIQDFNEFSEGKYSYLRIKKVELYEYEHKAELYFTIPEEIYENGFDNAIIRELNKFCTKVARGYTCEFFFERMAVTPEIVTDRVTDFVSFNYPFISASLNKTCIEVCITDRLEITLTLEQDVFDIINGTSFSQQLIEEIEETFVTNAELIFKVVPKGEITIEKDTESAIYSKNFVPLVSSEFLCGQNSQVFTKPIFIDNVSKAQDNATICGTVMEIIPREFEKNPDSPYKYYKFSYKIRLNDFTGELTVYFKTNDEQCPLKHISQGDQLLAKGRIAYSQRSSEFVMYCKTLHRCVLDTEKIKDEIKTLPPPEKLKIPAIKYEGNDFLVEQTLEDFTEDRAPSLIFDAVFFTWRSSTKSAFAPWEICMLSFTAGKCDFVYKSFVKISNIEAVDPEYKLSVSSAKRLAELIGDILCFSRGKAFVSKNVQQVVNELNVLAKPQRYSFTSELIDADKLWHKGSAKIEPSLERSLKENGIAVVGEDSYALAVAMAKLFIKVKK